MVVLILCSLLGNTPTSIQKLRKSKYHNRLQAPEHYSVSLFNMKINLGLCAFLNVYGEGESDY